MTSRLIYCFLFILLITACQNSKKNSDIKQIKGSGDSYYELVKLIVSVPMCEKPYYFDSFAHADDSVGFIDIPDSLISQLEKDSLLRKATDPMINFRSIKEIRNEGLRYGGDTVKFRFYKRLQFDSGHFYLLTAIKKNRIEPYWWGILSFDHNGKQVSAMDGIHGFYLSNNSLVTWWWFASNKQPDFMPWVISSDGQFKMISQSQEVPKPLIGIIDEFGKQIPNKK